jgi:hypothetical protein
MPYYIVNENSDGEKKQHLVSAKTQAAALKAIVEPRYSVVSATTEDAIALTAKGVKVIGLQQARGVMSKDRQQREMERKAQADFERKLGLQ